MLFLEDSCQEAILKVMDYLRCKGYFHSLRVAKPSSGAATQRVVLDRTLF
jgi:hypothetical protein